MKKQSLKSVSEWKNNSSALLDKVGCAVIRDFQK